MQVVITVSDDEYEAIMNRIPPLYYAAYLIQNGTPLPKGHGDLKDELDLDLSAPSLGTDGHIYELMAKHRIDYVHGDDEDKVRAFALDLIGSCMNVIETAPTVVGADKEK